MTRAILSALRALRAMEPSDRAVLDRYPALRETRDILAETAKQSERINTLLKSANVWAFENPNN